MSKISKAVRLQLAKMMQLYNEVKTEDGKVLSVEGEFAVGEEVFVSNDNGEFEPAADGTYTTTEGTIITVVGGKIESIEAKAAESDPEPPAQQEEEDTEPPADGEDDPAKLKDRIAELENQLADKQAENDALKAENEELKAKLAEYEALRKQSAEKPIEKQDPEQPKGENKYLAYARKHQ